ncbi:MAG: GrpB family protein [Sedimentisphaeraceae bacterium JB056]
MYLIGCLEILDSGSDAVEKFYISLMPKLKAVLSDDRKDSRLVGYRSEIDVVDGKISQFFGIEADRAVTVPQGMVGWDLEQDSLDVITTKLHKKLPIKWLWEDLSAAFVGEFESASMVGMDVQEKELSWHLTTNAPVSLNGVYGNDTVELVEYNPDWSSDFTVMQQKLEEELGDVATSIVHYGSTAIPGMAAKPIIDILIEVPSFELAAERLIKTFNLPEYEYWWYDDHMIFIKRDKPFGKRTHHIHIAPTGHRLWDGVVFRDYLIANPEYAARYLELKQRLAQEYKDDREAYTKAKNDFIKEVVQLAHCKADVIN